MLSKSGKQFLIVIWKTLINMYSINYTMHIFICFVRKGHFPITRTKKLVNLTLFLFKLNIKVKNSLKKSFIIFLNLMFCVVEKGNKKFC